MGQDEMRRRCLLGRLGGVAESVWMSVLSTLTITKPLIFSTTGFSLLQWRVHLQRLLLGNAARCRLLKWSLLLSSPLLSPFRQQKRASRFRC